MTMTVRELYKWAEEHDALDLDIEIRCGGCYPEVDDCEPEISDRKRSYHTERVVLL